METTDDILRVLSTWNPREVPHEAFAAARARRQEITPALVASLDDVICAGADATEEQTLLASYALYLLAEFREPRAFPAIERLFRLPAELVEEFTGDILTEDAPRMFAATVGGDTAALQRFAEDESLGFDLRTVGLRALIVQVAWGEQSRDEVAAYLTRYFHIHATRLADPEDVQMLASLCLDLGVTELREDIRVALERHPPEPVREDDPFPIPPLLTWTEAEAEFREGPQRGWRYQEPGREYGPPRSADEACAWWHGHDRETADDHLEDLAEEVADFLPEIAPPKIGRNDPCPCGSGKKFKKCCGANA